VVIVGYMGSGKTTVGRILARKLGWEFMDLDRDIERAEGRSIPEIFADSGEEFFRDLEHRALVGALDGSKERVIACGGGVVVRPENRDSLGEAATIFLHEDIGALYERTRGAQRPLRAASREEFEQRYEMRLPYYREVADLEVSAHRRPPEELAREIARWLLDA
jgi:shikimate kinase